VFLGASLALVGFFNYYYLYFAFIFAGIFYIHKFWCQRKALPEQLHSAVKSPVAFASEKRHYFVAAAVFLLLFSTLVLPLVLLMVSNSETGMFVGTFGGRTNIMNAVYLSAWPHHFITPNAHHPLFRWVVYEGLYPYLERLSAYFSWV